jgi:hypothetical protein
MRKPKTEAKPCTYLLRVTSVDYTEVPPAHTVVLVRQLVMTQKAAIKMRQRCDAFESLNDGYDHGYQFVFMEIDNALSMTVNELVAKLDEMAAEEGVDDAWAECKANDYNTEGV